MNIQNHGNASIVLTIIRMDMEAYTGHGGLKVDISTDDQLLLFLEDQYGKYIREENRLVQAIAGNAASVQVGNSDKPYQDIVPLESRLQTVRSQINTIAEGLFALGRVDTYKDIVRTLGPLRWDDHGSSRDWALAWCLVDLLPFPPPTSRRHQWMLDHITSISSWLDRNAAHLDWDETAKKYRLTKDSIGPLPWPLT